VSREQCSWRAAQATLGAAVGKGKKGVSKFALVVSAVCSASKKRRGRARVRLTFQSQTIAKIQVRQRGAVREGIQSPCGSEQSKYRQRCQGVQVSDGLGQHYFNCVVGEKKKKGETLRNSIESGRTATHP